MMKRLLFTILSAFVTVAISAEELVGRVVDGFAEAVPFASVYLKEDPYRGVMSDNDGFFSIDINPATDKKNHLICSFVGYTTYEKSISKISLKDTLLVVITEQPIELNATEVKAKISKKQSRKIKKTVLERFRSQLLLDFPYQKNEYDIVSVYEGSEDTTQLIRHQVIGTIIEYPKRVHANRDSLSLKVNSIQEYESEQVLVGYEKLNDIAADRFANNKKNKRRGMVYNKKDIDVQEVNMHEFLWGTSMQTLSRLLFYDKLNMWDYTVVGSQNVLTYTDSRNYIGIVKGTLQIHFYVDPATLSIQKVVQTLNGSINIPFGYKLKKDELELLNMVQSSTDTIEKYRVRHIEANIIRNVFFADENGRKVVKEKNIEGSMVLINPKKERLKFSARSKIVVSNSRTYPKKKK